LVCSIFDKEEKEMLEEEEIDKLILNAICSDIMDEVIDSGSANPTDGKTDPSRKSHPHHTLQSGQRRKQGTTNIVYNEGFFLEY
jgi:hypothetical protein